MGGVGALLATFGGAALYGLSIVTPFWAGSILMVIAALVVFVATGKNYNTIFWVAPAFMLVAIVCMFFVTRGEARRA